MFVQEQQQLAYTQQILIIAPWLYSWLIARFTFPTIVSCSTLRIGLYMYLFYKEKFIAQFKATEKYDRSPYSFSRKLQFISMAGSSCKEKAAIFLMRANHAWNYAQ